MSFYAYIVTNAPHGTLYVGHTDDLARRIYEHREKMRPGFTAKYGLSKLVWFEAFEFREHAFRRERQMKEWRRRWKIELIEGMNPRWEDFYEQLPNLIGLVTP